VIQLNKNTIYILVAVVVIIIVVGAAAVMFLNNGGNNNGTTPTPTPTQSVADATTLQFSANVTSQGQTTEYKWYGKNLQSDVIIRVDVSTYAYILDEGQQKAWASTDSGATWTTSDYTTDWAGWGAQWTEYVDKLANWTSGDYSYTNTAEESIVLFNIIVNPTIPDSTFATS